MLHLHPDNLEHVGLYLSIPAPVWRSWPNEGCQCPKGKAAVSLYLCSELELSWTLLWFAKGPSDDLALPGRNESHSLHQIESGSESVESLLQQTQLAIRCGVTGTANSCTWHLVLETGSNTSQCSSATGRGGLVDTSPIIHAAFLSSFPHHLP